MAGECARTYTPTRSAPACGEKNNININNNSSLSHLGKSENPFTPDEISNIPNEFSKMRNIKTNKIEETLKNIDPLTGYNGSRHSSHPGYESKNRNKETLNPCGVDTSDRIDWATAPDVQKKEETLAGQKLKTISPCGVDTSDRIDEADASSFLGNVQTLGVTFGGDNTILPEQDAAATTSQNPIKRVLEALPCTKHENTGVDMGETKPPLKTPLIDSTPKSEAGNSDSSTLDTNFTDKPVEKNNNDIVSQSIPNQLQNISKPKKSKIKNDSQIIEREKITEAFELWKSNGGNVTMNREDVPVLFSHLKPTWQTPEITRALVDYYTNVKNTTPSFRAVSTMVKQINQTESMLGEAPLDFVVNIIEEGTERKWMSLADAFANKLKNFVVLSKNSNSTTIVKKDSKDWGLKHDGVDFYKVKGKPMELLDTFECRGLKVDVFDYKDKYAWYHGDIVWHKPDAEMGRPREMDREFPEYSMTYHSLLSSLFTFGPGKTPVAGLDEDDRRYFENFLVRFLAFVRTHILHSDWASYYMDWGIYWRELMLMCSRVRAGYQPVPFHYDKACFLSWKNGMPKTFEQFLDQWDDVYAGPETSGLPFTRCKRVYGTVNEERFLKQDRTSLEWFTVELIKTGAPVLDFLRLGCTITPPIGRCERGELTSGMPLEDWIKPTTDYELDWKRMYDNLEICKKNKMEAPVDLKYWGIYSGEEAKQRSKLYTKLNK